jgi:signal transduction histidine kinase
LSGHLERSARALRAIVAGTAAATGEEFFSSLVHHFAAALDLRVAFLSQVTSSQPERACIVAMSDGGHPVAPFEYGLAGTPCAEVLSGKCLFFSRGVQQAFPDDEWLRENSIESYLAMPIEDGAGVVVGHLGVMGETEIEDVEEARDILRIFAARVDAELKRLAASEKLRAANKELDHFVRAASHDLRAPLAGIASLAVWLEEDAAAVLPEESREHLHLLRGRVARMQMLLDDLVTYSRATPADAPAEQVDTEVLIREIADDVTLPDGFTTAVDGALPTMNTGKTPLRLIFQNLIVNAVEHHDRDCGQVCVSARSVGPFIEFSVADDGPGIEPRFRERVFEPFHTLQPRDQKEASGVGLSIVRKIVRGCGGEVWVDGEVRSGTTVRFTWPRRWATDELPNRARP